MKTPEELAVDYALKNLETRILDRIGREEARLGFLAGYQAAKDQLADTSKVMPDTCEHILDMSKMVDVSSSETLNNSSNNSNGWISVKDRLPEERKHILWCHEPTQEIAVGYLLRADIKPYFTHWMPLPKAPEE